MEKTLSFTDTSPQTVKIGDTTTSFTLVCGNYNKAVDLTHVNSITVKLGNSSGYLKSITVDPTVLADPTNGKVTVAFNSDLLNNLPAGRYAIEVWVVDSTGTSIYPSDGSTGFTITNNIQSANGSTITTIAFDDFVAAMNKAASTIAKGDPGEGLDIKGQVTSVSALPTTANEGDGYLVNEELYVYTSGAWKDCGPIQGPQGIQGKTGTGISSTTIQYQISNSATTSPTGTWSNSIVATTITNPYLWMKATLNYTDGTTKDFYLVSQKGEKGEKGDKGDTGPQGIQGPKGDADVADNSITLEKLSTNVYTSDYFNLSNINLNGANTIGVITTFKRSEIINGASEINLKGTLKENCATNRLAQATINIIGSEVNDLTADNGDVVANQVVSFDKTQKNIEKTLDLNFSVDLQQKPFIKLIISYAFDSNAGASTDTINLDPLELLVANENLNIQQKGIFIGNAGTAEISARITGKAGLATNAQLAKFVTKNDIKNVADKQSIYVTTAKEFVDAIDTAKNTATSDQWVTINMAPGTYDLLPFVNLDISEVSALDNRGIEVPQYTKIVGDPAMGTLIVLRLPDETKTEAKWTVSPINLKNEAWLENLKIISFNCRYAIHDDGGTVGYSRLLKNCILINEGHGTVEFVNETPYGCGIYKGCHAYYDNVTFKGAGMAAYVHDNPTYDIESSLTFNNCTFDGGAQHPDFAVRFHGLGGSADTNIKLINCKLNKPYQVWRETDDVRQSMVITEIGNSLFDDSVSLALSKKV